jgi:hypothetical protein
MMVVEQASSIVIVGACLCFFLVVVFPPSFSLSVEDTQTFVVVHPHASEQKKSSFIETFQRLNQNRSGPYIVFRGNKQGLGNNLLQFASSVAFSVYLNSSFRYSWDSAGMLSDLSTIIDLPVQGLSVNYTNSSCEWNLACCHGTNHSAPSECWAALACTCVDSHIFDACPHLMISANVYWIHVLQANPCFQERMNAFFPPGSNIAASLFRDGFLAPSARAEAGIREHLESFDEWMPDVTLGVHFRSIFVPVDQAMACINQTFATGLYKYIFLATDRIPVREQLAKVFGPRLLFFNYTITDLEQKSEREGTVHLAWQEAVTLARLPNKLLSLPLSTLSHVIYSMSDPQSNVIDLSTCTRHVGHFLTWVGPPACTSPTGNGSINACTGRFPFRH